MTQRVAWLFNLDAEEELRHPGRHTRSPEARARLQVLRPRLDAFVQPGDIVVDDNSPRLDADDSGNTFVGQAWCPTRTAVERLRQVGAKLPPFPATDVLRRVNHRRFCADLGQMLPGATFATEIDALQQHAAKFPRTNWLLKRPFGFSGRQRLLCALPATTTREHDWIRASFAHGDGLQMEPWVERQQDCVVHGYLQTDASVRLGDVCVQECDPRGAWLDTRLSAREELTPGDVSRLLEAAHATAAAMAAAGYWGPFGIDSYRWIDAGGDSHWNLRSDINARYTMGWATGMRGWRPRWEDATLT